MPMQPTPPQPHATTRSPRGPSGVHFCQGGLKGGGASIGSGVTAAIIPTALLGGLALSVAGFFALARYPWLPLAVRATVISLVFLVGMTALFRIAARGYRRSMSSLRLPMEMDPDARVNVICWPDQKEHLEPMMPAGDDPGYFEPEACRVWVAQRTSHAALMQDPKFARRFFVAVCVFPVILQIGMQGLVHNYISRSTMLIFIALVAAAIMAPIVWGFLFPKYLRIAPGRLDIVRFGLLGAAPTIETISLRDRPVRLDLRRRELLLGGWHKSHPDPDAEPKPEPEPMTEPDSFASATGASGEEEPTSRRRRFNSALWENKINPNLQTYLGSPTQIKALTIIPLWATTSQGTLADAVFRAAVSTAEPGPLPDDRLTG